MTKMIKIELYVIPISDMDSYNTNTIISEYIKTGKIDNLILHIGDVEETDIGEYNDDHKLNKKGTEIYAFRKYFEKPDVKIRKVEILRGRAKQQAIDMGLKSSDIVLVTTTIPDNGLPIYELEKIEGDPITYLQKKFLKDVPVKECKKHKGYTYYGTGCPLCDADKENNME
jgi:hypothetical protein